MGYYNNIMKDVINMNKPPISLNTLIIRLTILLVTVLCYSCENHRINREIKKIYGTKIDLPNDLLAKIQDKDTIIKVQDDEFVTLIIWYDSLQCASCNVDYIEQWNGVFKYSEDSVKGFRPIIIFTPSKENLLKLELSLKTTDFKYTVYIDYNYSFVNRNPQLSKCKSQNVYLLNKEHEIVLVGNPCYNIQMRQLYKKTIKELIANKGVLPIETKQ